MAADTETDGKSKWTTITVTPEMRDRLRSMKRGGESYTDLFERMIEQYDPDEAQATN